MVVCDGRISLSVKEDDELLVGLELCRGRRTTTLYCPRPKPKGSNHLGALAVLVGGTCPVIVPRRAGAPAPTKDSWVVP
ncbi:hypothetical protein CGRA01v4_04713 [Colletotrichum graminicola]|nr:hypothetical protein CGRA01v4_04713 [Colletotrichum graminicola]